MEFLPAWAGKWIRSRPYEMPPQRSAQNQSQHKSPFSPLTKPRRADLLFGPRSTYNPRFSTGIPVSDHGYGYVAPPLLGRHVTRRMCRGRYAVLFGVGVRLAEVGEFAPRALAVGSDAVTQRLVGRESQHHIHDVISQGADR